MRTAEKSAGATDILAKEDAKTLAILGGGKQGIAHALAICAIRNIEKIYVWSYRESTVESCCSALKKALCGIEIIPCKEGKDAVTHADIICTTTAAKTDVPILKGEWVKKGAHINAIGACRGRKKREECRRRRERERERERLRVVETEIGRAHV